MDYYSAHFNQRFSDLTSLERQKVWLSLASLKRDERAIEALIEDLPLGDFDTVLTFLFEINLAELVSLIDKSMPTIATSFYCSATCNQMRVIADGLQASNRYQHIACVWLSEIAPECAEFTQDFHNLFFLALPRIEHSSSLLFLQAVFLSELNQYCHWQFSPEVIRIGCPHGADVPLLDSLIKYGGIFHYDFLLQAKPAQISEQQLSRYLVSTKGSHQLTLLPFGIPKIDVLYHQATRTVPDKIIAIHLSNWQLETGAARSQVQPLIKALLTHFSDYRILIRPFPGDIRQQSLLSQLKPFQNNSQVEVDKNASYLTLYSKVSLLITQRLETGHNFSFATFRPIIALIEQEKAVVKQPLGYSVNNIESVISQAKHCLDNEKKERVRISNHAQNTIYNLGSSLAFLTENLDEMLESKKPSQQRYQSLVLTGTSHYKAALNNALSDAVFIGQQVERLLVATPPTDTENYLWLCYFAVETNSQCPDPVEHTYYYNSWYTACKYLLILLRRLECLNEELINRLHRWYCLYWQTFQHGFEQCTDLFMAAKWQDIKVELNQLLMPFQDYSQAFHLSSGVKAENYWWRFNYKEMLKNIGSCRSVYLFGANDICQQLVYFLEIFTDIKVLKIVDNHPKKVGGRLLGYQIVSLDSLMDEPSTASKLDTASQAMIICSLQHGEEIASSIQRKFPKQFNVVKATPSL